MNKIIRFILCICLIIASTYCANIFGGHKIQNTAQAQSMTTTVNNIKAKILSVVGAANGKVSAATKTRLIELISNKIKASPNEIITDIYVFFLKEVKKLRTTDEIIALSDISNNGGSANSSTTENNAENSGPDFSISFANISDPISVDQKFATINIKLKNNGSAYSSDGLGSLKFGCKGLDNQIYPYRSYIDTTTIGNNGELVLEVANVFIGNLTASKGFKLLTCKIDSSDLISESNEDNNVVNVSVQIY